MISCGDSVFVQYHWLHGARSMLSLPTISMINIYRANMVQLREMGTHVE